MSRHFNRAFASHLPLSPHKSSPLPAPPPHCNLLIRTCSYLPVLTAPPEPGQRAPERLHFRHLSYRRPSLPLLHLLQGGKGLPIAMAGAIKTFLAAFLVVAVAAVAVHAHNGEDHGPASAPHSSESGAATLVASLMAPLLVAAGAFAASALQL